jgi:putative AlgH/UPF0301 family transcriptional regulator
MTCQGQLLISAGGLFDTNFRQTVVLIGSHDARGAVGVIVNRPLDVTVRDATPMTLPHGFLNVAPAAPLTSSTRTSRAVSNTSLNSRTTR